MKKILLIAAILFSALSFEAKAQVSVNINIGRQPVWGPVGYDYVNYYYLPDLGVYYDVPRGLFVYFDFGHWNFAATLPPRFGHYDLYRSYKVVINDRNPWLRNSYYRTHYYNYRGRPQMVIRDSHDNRYFTAREHYNNGRGNERRPEYNNRGNNNRFEERGNAGRNSSRGNDHGNRGKEKHGDRDRH